MKKLKQLLITNWQLKIFALLVAIFFWFYVASSFAKVSNFPGTIPIELRNMPQNLVAILDKDSVSVKLAAEGFVWQRLSSSSFQAYIDLAGLSIGTHEVEVKVEVLASGVQIVEKKPSKVLVRLEPKISKEVPVVAKIEGKAGEGLVFETPEISPPKVEVSGAASVISKIFQASAIVQLSGETESKTVTCKLVALNEQGEKISQLQFSPEEVKVTIPLVKIEEVKTVGILPKLQGTPSSSFWISKVEVTPSVISITGKSSILRGINYIETSPINIDGISEDKTLSVSLKLPEHVAAIGQSTVKVSIGLSQTSPTKEVIASINFKNLAGNLTVSSVSPDTVKVVISATADILKNISPANVVLNLDLSGKGVGTYNLDLSRENFSLPKDAVILSFLPSSLSITLQSK